MHPNGVEGVASLAIAVHDLDVTLSRYRALLGEGAPEAQAHVGRPVALAGSDVRLSLIELGRSTLVLLSPRDPIDGPSSPLAQRLATRGEGPYAIALRTAAAAPARVQLDPSRTHGALIEFNACVTRLRRNAPTAGASGA